ncbi:winged helix-turn-helix transcriptional regulator [Kitasatospora sp. NPDC048298]|uniref:winged helix-turn-helix transcriptional regulator n=1 Tax=Kitasatospora sp. NPDC048298 TaxID=3364049 RepID=UPI0037170CD1
MTRLGELVGVSEQVISTRLNRMQADRLVARTGSRHREPYTLSNDGRALTPVYAAVQQWDTRHSAAPPARVPAVPSSPARTPCGPRRRCGEAPRPPACSATPPPRSRAFPQR